MKQALSQAKNLHEERTAPLRGKTQPFATQTVVAYGQRLAARLEGVKLEAEAPTSEQLAVLNGVAQRVLQEFQSEKQLA